MWWWRGKGTMGGTIGMVGGIEGMVGQDLLGMVGAEEGQQETGRQVW